MIQPTAYNFSISQINQLTQTEFIKNLIDSTGDEKVKAAINQPSGDFFYDPWIIKPEFQNTIFEELLNSLPIPAGEARFIVLKSGSCYHSHADIDDRYHLSIQGQYSYLINLDNCAMFPTETDGVWYNMNAGPRHVAANFGSINRIQLVVRQLLRKNHLINPLTVSLSPEDTLQKARFVFDDIISPWLNRANKLGIISNFKTDQKQIWFDIESDCVNDLTAIISPGINFISNLRYNAR